MSRIERQVAENRDNTRRLDGQFISVPETGNRTLTFARNEIEVSAEVAIYTRPLNDSLISGHPNGDVHGSGHGESGDIRGGWTLVTDTEVSGKFLRTGRNAVRDALAGQPGALATTALGTDGATASVTDTALSAEAGSTDAYGIGDAPTVTRGRSNYLFHEDGLGDADAVEFGLFDDTGRLLARLTTDPVDVTEEEEIRVDVSLTVDGNGAGDSVVTDHGLAAIADSVRSPSVAVGLEELAFGTGTTAADPSDTALKNEEYRRTAGRTLDPERISLATNTPALEPSGQPVDLTEVGVFDNQGRLVWRVTMDPFNKTEDFGFRTRASFRIV